MNLKITAIQWAFVLITVQQHQMSCLEVNTQKVLALSNNYKAIDIEYSDTYSFVIVQSHSQYRKNTISFQAHSQYGYEYKSLDSGIIKSIRNHSNNGMLTVFVKSSETNNVNAVVLAIPVKSMHPIPGGCCLTCALENDPNIKITSSKYKTTVSFQRASTYNSNLASSECDSTENPSTYDLIYYVYYYYIDENDYTEESLFNSIFKMSTPEKIRSNGLLLNTFSGKDSLKLEMETVFAQGVVINVIVSDSTSGRKMETAYVPAAVYACDFTAPKDSSSNCHARGSLTVLIFCIMFGIVGVVLCVAGFRLYRLLVFSSGVGLYWFITFIIMSKYLDPKLEIQTGTLIISFMLSLVGGAFTLLLYGFEKCFYVVFLKICALFGMFLSSIIFYTPFGYYSVWDEDYQFILGFVSFTLATLIFSLFAPKFACYFCSSLIGSYAILMVFNYFMRSNMQYIVLTIVNRFIVPDFGKVYLRRPFAHAEYILCGVWAGLFLLGVIIQYATTRKLHFRYNGNELRHKVWEKFSESVNLGNRKNKSKQKSNLRRPIPSRQYTRSPSPDERTALLDSVDGLDETSNSQLPNYGGCGEENQGYESELPVPTTTTTTSQPPHHTALLLLEHEPLLSQPISVPSAPELPPSPPPYYKAHDSFNNQNVPPQHTNGEANLSYDDLQDQRVLYTKPAERYPKLYKV